MDHLIFTQRDPQLSGICFTCVLKRLRKATTGDGSKKKTGLENWVDIIVCPIDVYLFFLPTLVVPVVVQIAN